MTNKQKSEHITYSFTKLVPVLLAPLVHTCSQLHFKVRLFFFSQPLRSWVEDGENNPRRVSFSDFVSKFLSRFWLPLTTRPLPLTASTTLALSSVLLASPEEP